MAPLVLGLDVGGSKTAAVLSDGQQTHADLAGGSANPASVGLVEAGRQLDAIAEQLDGARPAAVYAGVAGADTPESRHRFRQLLARRWPGARIRVEHDSALVLAAAGTRTGIAVIAGTGSVAWGCDRDGRTARAGGWGYLVGDEGSGYWITREAVRQALRRADQGLEPDPFGAALAAGCGLADPGQLLDHFYAQPERRYWAARAGIMFRLADRGDPVATAIVAEAVAALIALAATVGHRLDLTGPLVLAGGLAVHHPALSTAVRAGLAARGMTDVRVLDRDPVHGAVRLAVELLETGSSAETDTNERN